MLYIHTTYAQLPQTQCCKLANRGILSSVDVTICHTYTIDTPPHGAHAALIEEEKKQCWSKEVFASLFLSVYSHLYHNHLHIFWYCAALTMAMKFISTCGCSSHMYIRCVMYCFLSLNEFNSKLQFTQKLHLNYTYIEIAFDQSIHRRCMCKRIPVPSHSFKYK